MNFREFIEKYEKVKVKEYANSVPQNPVVSVCVQTYQHAIYIRECLDGILMQETDFPFEILLGEDASTDGTRAICIEYAEKYPDKIRLFLHHRENNISINGSPTGRFNFVYNLLSSKGQYIALCEGDDFWTDPKKLKKQYGAILKDKNISLVSCKVDHIENKNIIGNGKGGSRTYFFQNNEEISGMASYAHFIYHGDNLLKSILAVRGKEHILEDKMAVWRKHEGGVWGSLLDSEENKLKMEFQRASSTFWIGIYHFDKGRRKIAIEYIVKAMLKLMIAVPELQRSVAVNFYKKSLKRLISKILGRG